MKNVFLIALLISTTLAAVAQNPADTIRESRTERFADSAHGLIHTEQIYHGHIVGNYVTIYRATDMVTGKTLSGLMFTDAQGRHAVVDADELPALLNAMNQIIGKVIPTKPANIYELYCFRSRGGFEAGCYVDSKSQWQLYLKLKSKDNTTTTLLKQLDLEVFLEDLKDVINQVQ